MRGYLLFVDVDDYQRQMWLVLRVDVGVALEAVCIWVNRLGKGSIEKKRFLSGIARIMGGGSTHARIFWPSF